LLIEICLKFRGYSTVPLLLCLILMRTGKEMRRCGCGSCHFLTRLGHVFPGGGPMLLDPGATMNLAAQHRLRT
jgi:hypothetical protein